MRFSQKPWAHLCCYGMSCKPFLQCSSISWSRGSSNLVTMRNKIWGPITHTVVQPVLYTLCRVCRRSVQSVYIIWFLSDIIGHRKNFRLQNFFVNGKVYSVHPFEPNWRLLLNVRCYVPSVMIEARCLVVDTLRCPETSFSNVLFVEDRIKGESFLIGKYEDSNSVIHQIIQQMMLLCRRFWIIAAINRGFLLFPPIFWPSWVKWR